MSPALKRKEMFTLKKPRFLLIAVSGPWEIVATDSMAPYKLQNLWNCYILIAGDLFTKDSEAAALLSFETTLVAQVLLGKVVFRHGSPHKFLTDRGTKLTRKLMEQICKDLYINKIFTAS